MEKPKNLIDAENSLRIARLQYQVAKSKSAIRKAGEDFEFWSNKVDMLTVMFEKGMIGSNENKQIKE